MATSMFEALSVRRAELIGSVAPTEELASLELFLRDSSWDTLLQVYRELPVCGSAFCFVVDDNQIASRPGADFRSTYDPEREHEFRWLFPRHVLAEIKDSYAGPSAFACGFLPIGSCAIGGDWYYVRSDVDSAMPSALYRVYHDWIDPRAEVGVPPQATKVVAKSVVNVIEVARIERG